jgi:diacylglycerol kinase family enzyme/membrane-associated phospholipid phosphatase
MRSTVHRIAPGWLARADLALFRTVARSRVRGLDAVLPRLSRAANHSQLWVAAGLLLALTGGRWGRRASLRGLLAVGLTSATVNLPLKLALRRARPPIDLVPHARRLRRLPTSSSLPSGHAASAAAFATGVALELPSAALPVAAAATAVAFSRIYTGVHYPVDVVAGAAIGAGIAVASTRWWPLAPSPDEAPPALARAGQVPSLPEGEGLVCCVNRRAGGLWSPGQSSAAQLELRPDAEELIRRHLPRTTFVPCSDDDLAAGLDRAAAEAHAVGVAGGDGSANAAAAVARRHRLPLLVIPAGTHNHFARDLGLRRPSDPLDAVQRGETVAVDLATVADRPFLNAASLGGYASMVSRRERLEGSIGKWPALLWGLLRTLRHDEPVRVEVDGRARRLWMLFAGNCRYHPRGFGPGWRERLDDGLLDVRVVDAEVPWARTRLVLSVLTGRLGRCRAYDEWTARSVRVRSLQGPLRLVRDGEVFDGPEEFTIQKVPEPIEVFAPLPTDRAQRPRSTPAM